VGSKYPSAISPGSNTNTTVRDNTDISAFSTSSLSQHCTGMNIAVKIDIDGGRQENNDL
jgi:hypothetical protein